LSRPNGSKLVVNPVRYTLPSGATAAAFVTSESEPPQVVSETTVAARAPPTVTTRATIAAAMPSA
jgi:hypothetical protein